MKNFVKALDRNGPAFSLCCGKFPRLNMEIKAGVFIGPKIHQLFRDWSMSLRMQFLHLHLDSFLVNCGVVNDKHSECFHHDISAMEKRYKSKWSAATLAGYCWMVKRGVLEIQYKQQVKRCLV
jgi:hypothetical protein